MPERAASRTAAFVAGLRGSCNWLPQDCRLVSDPYAFKLVPGTTWERLLHSLPSFCRWLLRHGSAAHKAVMVLQLRTKGFDDAVRAELKKGLAQVLVLGAGYDARALRLAPEQKQAKWVEIDMPASQIAKRESLAVVGVSTSHIQFIPWDFIQKPVKDLPKALQEAGISPEKPSVVTWEGVTGYLTEEAISETVKALAVACAPGSALIFNYSTKKLDEVVSPGLFESVRRALWRLCWRVVFPQEEFRFGGWAPGTLAPWLKERGWELESDATYYDLAVRYLSKEHVPLATGFDAPLAASDLQHVIIARRRAN